MIADKPSVVIDNGSRYIKAGFACDNHPVSMFRSVVGRPSYLNGKYGKYGLSYDVLIGDDAMSKISEYDLNSPIQNGRIVHWDNMERIWHHIFYKELKAAPEDRNVVLTCTSTCPMSEKLKCCEIFFEVLNAPAIAVQPQGVLALYGSGCVTGLVVDIGYGKIEITPIYQGGIISYAIVNPGYASKYISDYLQWSLAKRNIDLGCMAEEYLDDLMRNTLYVTRNTAMARRGYERFYKLPTGEVIDVSQESFLAPEIFFNPSLIEQPRSDIISLTDGIITSSLKCDTELRNELFANVVLSGGLAMIPGLSIRLQHDIEKRSMRPTRVLSTNESYAVSWLGGATYAGLKDAQKLFVTRQQYEEHGMRIIKIKFL